MGPVGRFPRGFLDLLGLKQQGQYMRDVADVIAPTFSIEELLLENNAERHVTTARVVDIGGAGGTVAGGFYGLTPSLSASQQEVLIVTDWTIRGQWIGTGAIMPDFTMGAWQTVGGTASLKAFEPLQYGTFPGLNLVSRLHLRSSRRPMICPQGHEVLLMLCDTATGVAAGSLQIDAFVRYIRVTL